jgi:nucleoside-diphosphate-sugar epimerase
MYKLGNGVPVCFNHWLYYAKGKLYSSSKITNIEQKEFHKKVQSSRSFYMDNSKLKVLGYSPQYGIQRIVDELIA